MIEPKLQRCARHTNTETYVTCSKCGTPICPRCMIHTPVGYRCPECAQLRSLPTFHVSGSYMLRAVGAGLGVAVVAGAAWTFIPFLSLFMAVIAGYAAGEVISRAANRKRGRALQVIGALSVLGAFFFSRMFVVVEHVSASGRTAVDAGDLTRLTVNATLAGLLNPLGAIVVVIGIVLAVRRLG